MPHGIPLFIFMDLGFFPNVFLGILFAIVGASFVRTRKLDQLINDAEELLTTLLDTSAGSSTAVVDTIATDLAKLKTKKPIASLMFALAAISMIFLLSIFFTPHNETNEGLVRWEFIMAAIYVSATIVGSPYVKQARKDILDMTISYGPIINSL